MTLASEKKCMPITSPGRCVATGDLVDVEARGVGRQHRAGLGDLVELLEDAFLHFMVSNTASMMTSASFQVVKWERA